MITITEFEEIDALNEKCRKKLLGLGYTREYPDMYIKDTYISFRGHQVKIRSYIDLDGEFHGIYFSFDRKAPEGLITKSIESLNITPILAPYHHSPIAFTEIAGTKYVAFSGYIYKLPADKIINGFIVRELPKIVSTLKRDGRKKGRM